MVFKRIVNFYIIILWYCDCVL